MATPCKLLYLFIFAIFVRANALTDPEDLRIIGGEETTIEDVPYQLQMEHFVLNTWEYACGAVIIGDQWAVSAGQCAEGFEARNIRFLSGSTIRGNGSVYTVQSVTTHPNFTNYGGWAYNDISVFRVTPAFQFNNRTQVIQLIQEQPNAGVNATVSGWGTFMPGDLSSVLLKDIVPIADQALCARIYGASGYEVDETMLCAGNLDDADGACTDDTGGPLVVDGKLAGIVSYGELCGQADYAMIYTNIKTFFSWIQQQVNGQYLR